MQYPSHSSIAISKGMDEFELVMELRALDQWMKTPVDETVDLAGYEFRRGCHIYNLLSIEDFNTFVSGICRSQE